MKTYAGQAKRLERAVTVAFYRMAEALHIARPAARQGVERADRFLQRVGTVYLAVFVVAIVIAYFALGETLGQVQVAGGIAVVMAVVLLQWAETRKWIRSRGVRDAG